MAQILQRAKGFRILTPKSILARQIMMVEQMARICYQSYHGKRITMKTAERFVRMLIRKKHFAMLEHGVGMSVIFPCYSRGLTHELVRMRIASYAQESTRYVNYTKKGGEIDLENFELRCIVPPHCDPHESVELADGSLLTPKEMFDMMETFYRALRKQGWKPEDARQILPIGIKSEIGITANLRGWRHIFSLRTAKPAHWEIRGVMCDLLYFCKATIPGMFDDFHEAGTLKKDGGRYFEQRPLEKEK